MAYSKPILIIAIIFSCASCNINDDPIRKEIYNGDRPFADEEIKSTEISTNGSATIIEKRSFWGSVNYYAGMGSSGIEEFLLNMDPLDSGEVLDSFTWYNNYFVMHIKNSARFTGATRFAVFFVNAGDNLVNKVLDVKDITVKAYSLDDSTLNYFDNQNNKYSIELK